MASHNAISNISDNWKLLEYQKNGTNEVWFFRKNLGASAIKADKNLHTLVYFTVKYQPENDSGLPSAKDTEILYNFEEKVIPEIEKNGACIMVASVLKSGIKDHLFYVTDPDLFLKTISLYKNHIEKFGVHFEKVEDPTWRIYEEFPEGT